MIIRLKIDTRMHARLSIYLRIVNCHFYSMRDYMYMLQRNLMLIRQNSMVIMFAIIENQNKRTCILG